MYPGQWSNGRPDDNQMMRFKQIDSLRQYFPTVKEVTKEQLYEIPNITLPSRQALTLRIHLASDFPRSAPRVQIFPPVSHPLVDQQMLVQHDSLTRWSTQSLLGRAIYEVIQKFMQQPPQILRQQQQPPMHQPPMQQGMQYSNSHQQQTTSVPQNHGNTHTPLPVIPSSFPELDAKSASELSALLNDEREFQKFFDNLDLVKTMKDVRDSLRNNVEELSKKNITKEAEIERVKKDIASRLHIVNEKRAAFEQKAQKQQEIMKQFTTPALIEKLGDAANDAEVESDAIAQKFLDGDMEQKEFVKTFMESRKLYHLRSAKKESLTMLMR